MGRTKGQINKNSMAAWLSTFEVGEKRYTETTLEGYQADQRMRNMPVTRRPEYMKEWVFSTLLFTAVSASRAGDIRYLTCTERLK